jgi:hypothetical protein
VIKSLSLGDPIASREANRRVHIQFDSDETYTPADTDDRAGSLAGAPG